MNTVGIQLRISDLLFAVQKRWKIILSLTLMGLVFGLLLSGMNYVQSAVEDYQIDGSFIIAPVDSQGRYSGNSIAPNRTDLTMATELYDTVYYLLRSDRLLYQVINDEQLLGVSASDIRNALSISQYSDTTIITMRLTWDHGDEGLALWQDIINAANDLLSQLLQVGRLRIFNEPVAVLINSRTANIKTWMILPVLGFAAGMGFAVTVRNEGEPDKYYFSEWSNIASVGKDAEASGPLTKDDLDAPVITGLRMTDKEFNDNPIVAFTLTVPDKLMENATKVEASGGGIVIEVWARVKGDAEFTQLQGDWIIKAGEMESALFNLANDARPHVEKDTVIELRCRYRYDHPNYFDGEIYSDWSKTISFGTDDINQGQSTVTDSTQPTAPVDPADPGKKTCQICHFCPQPLGICIFIWLLIIVVIAVVLIIVLKKKGKEKK